MGGITSTGASQFANISGSAGSQTKKKDNVGRDEFLQLLITQLKNQIQSERKTVEEAEETYEALHDVLKMLQDYDVSLLMNAMRLLKKNNPIAFESQKNNFDNWDDSLMSQGEVEE